MIDNKVNANKKHEKLIHITKRLDTPLLFKVIVRVISVLVAFIICAFVLNIFKPGKFFSFFSGSFKSLVGSKKMFFNTLFEFALLLGISIAILPSFKMKFWNLGGEGQILMGAFGAALVSKFIGPSVPNFLTIVLMVIAGMLFSAIWALIPAFFKAKFDTNETLFTLMMNYIAMGIIEFFGFVVNPSHGNFAGLTSGCFVFTNTNLYVSLSAIIPFLIVAFMTVFMYAYLNYTKDGYELTVVGETRNTAKYVGINVKKVIIRTVILSGLLCGIVGYFCVAKQSSISKDMIGGRGFTAVMITWLGHFNVIEVTVMSFLVAFITRGSNQIASDVNLGDSFVKISIAVFLIVILAFEFFLNYEVHINKGALKINKKNKEESK